MAIHWDREQVINGRFDDWWESHWIALFSVVDMRQEQPKFQLSTKQPKANGLRLSLLTWQHRDAGDMYAIAQSIIKHETDRKRPIPNILLESNNLDGSGHDKRIVQSKVGEYLRTARSRLQRVCEGNFP